MYQLKPIMGRPGRGCTVARSSVAIRAGRGSASNRCHCSTVTSLAAMAKRRGMTMRRGVSIVPLRSGSVGGDPMRNSTGPSITAKVCPWPLTNQRRSPRSLSFINSASSSLSFSCCPHLPQGPFRRPVDAAVGVVAVEIEQLAGQRLPLAGDSPSVPYVPNARISARRFEVSGWNRMASIFCWPLGGRGLGRWGRSGRVRRRSASDRHPGDSAS